MKNLFIIPEKWFRSFVFLMWLTVITALLHSGKYVLFLRPDFDVLLGVSVVILAGFVYSGSGSSRIELTTENLLKGFILILPLLYLFNADGNGLGASSLEKRITGLPKISMKHFNAEGIKPDDRPTSTIAPVKTTLLEIYKDMGKYKGLPVTVTGMLSHNKKIRETLGNEAVILFRFSVNCCAADALPYLLVIKKSDLSASGGTLWVEATGVFDLEKINKEIMPVLKNPVLKKVETPKSPFLF